MKSWCKTFPKNIQRIGVDLVKSEIFYWTNIIHEIFLFKFTRFEKKWNRFIFISRLCWFTVSQNELTASFWETIEYETMWTNYPFFEVSLVLCMHRLFSLFKWEIQCETKIHVWAWSSINLLITTQYVLDWTKKLINVKKKCIAGLIYS